MEWIRDPNLAHDDLHPEGCWIDVCANFCGIQICLGQECSLHLCGVYVY